MKWESAVFNKNKLEHIPSKWLHLHYFEALNILFRYENSLRIFVYAVLKNEYFNDWKKCSFPTNNESNSISISAIASKRINQSQNYGYLGYEVKCPIMHLTSGELIEIITSNAYWPKFSQYFKGSKEIIKNKFLEIGTVRNSLAHFRPIKTDDIELIKQNTLHTLNSVEECLENLLHQSTKVPTNTDDNWYKTISTLGNDYLKINLLYSSDEKWVNINLIFKTVVLEKKPPLSSIYTYQVIRINTPNIINEFPAIQNYVTFVSEYQDYPSLNKQYDLVTTKNIKLVFKKDIIEKHYEKISEGLKSLLIQISQEGELLSNDILARGKILDIVNVTAYTDDDSKWEYHFNKLKNPWKTDDPDEYWGDLYYFGYNIVSDANKYPWMPSDISDYDDFLF